MAADTRISWGKPTIYTEDGKQKLLKTTMGLITGSGFSILLDSVTERLEAETIVSTSQIEEAINDEISNCYEEYLNNPNDFYEIEDLEGYIRCTNWIYSYITQSEDGEPLLRLSLFAGPESRDRNGKNYLIRDRSAGILLPGEFDETKRSHYSDKLNSRLASELHNDPAKDIYTINVIFGELIDEISELSDSVSKEYHFGIHMLDGLEIFSPAEVVELLKKAK